MYIWMTSRFPSADKFCSVADFKKFVQKVVQCRLYLKDDRDSILKELNKLEKDAPFSRTIRFPEDDYFYLNYQFQMDYLLPLRFLINEIDENGQFTNDLKQQFKEILYRFQMIAERPDLCKSNEKYVFNRDSFESHFHVTWSETPVKRY